MDFISYPTSFMWFSGLVDFSPYIACSVNRAVPGTRAAGTVTPTIIYILGTTLYRLFEKKGGHPSSETVSRTSFSKVCIYSKIKIRMSYAK